MKKFLYVLLIIVITFIAGDDAFAVCSCKQPAYKNEIDFLTSYTACLEQCFSSHIEQIRQQLDEYGKRIPALESEINRLNLKIENLESERAAAKEKK
jgi:peptidoglycan hydrolase CwlO-like protein